MRAGTWRAHGHESVGFVAYGGRSGAMASPCGGIGFRETRAARRLRLRCAIWLTDEPFFRDGSSAITERDSSQRFITPNTPVAEKEPGAGTAVRDLWPLPFVASTFFMVCGQRIWNKPIGERQRKGHGMREEGRWTRASYTSQ